MAQPRFTWQLVTEKRNVMQSAYELKVTQGKNIVWSTEKVSSDQSVHVPYGGPALQSGMKYTWQVRVWDNSGKASAWSTACYLSDGFPEVIRLEGQMD